jgi:signal transduction histidine kinase
VNITLIDLRALIRDTVDYLQPAISQSGQLLNVFLPDSLPLVPADGERLRQVLINLIDNAMKYTPSGSEITVAAREEGIDLIVEVKDNGEGMSGELRERLFQPYSRVRSDRQSLKGLGLGLLIARNIVELHGGKIWVKSNSGAGTTFSFSIPLSAANSASQRETPGP